MAKVIITLKDDGESIDVDAEFTPPANDDQELTFAQKVGLWVCTRIAKQDFSSAEGVDNA